MYSAADLEISCSASHLQPQICKVTKLSMAVVHLASRVQPSTGMNK